MQCKTIKSAVIKTLTILLILFCLPVISYTQQAKVNVNLASFEELTSVSGIDETIAAKIIKYRRENNNFKTIYDLMKINEINGELFEKIKDKITIGEKSSSGGTDTADSHVSPVKPPVRSNNNAPSGSDSPAPKMPADPAAASVTPDSGSSNNDRIVEPPSNETASDNSQTAGKAGSSGVSNSFEDGRSSSYSSSNAASVKSNEENFPRRRVSRIDDEIKKIEMTPENYYKVIMGLMRLGKYEKAEKSLQDFLVKFPDDKRSDDANYLLGACFEEKEDYKMAINFYQKVYENAKSQIRGISIFRIGICNDILGKPGDAIEAYRRYVSEFPQSSSVKDAETRIETLLKK